MKYVKRTITIFLICIIAILAVFISYAGIENGAIVYAEDNLLTNDELDVAIHSYLESHGGNLFSPSNYRARKTYEAGLIHNFVYGLDDGYDGLRQHISGGIGGNNELRFDFDGFIIQKLNTWLNSQLQNGAFGEDVTLNEDGLFDNGIDNTLYSGKIFIDSDNNYCLVYIRNSSNTYSSDITTLISNIGTPYVYKYETLINLELPYSGTFHLTNNTNYNYNITTYTTGNFRFIQMDSNGSSKKDLCSWNNNVPRWKGTPVIFLNTNGNYVLGSFSTLGDGDAYQVNTYGLIDFGNEATPENVDVNFVTNNLNIGVTEYPDIEADGTLYITPKVKVGAEYKPYTINQGDTITNVINNYYNDSNTPDKTTSTPSDQPNGSGGGSGGGSSGGTIPDWNNPFPNLTPDGEGGFNFNFTLPDLNIDWNINGLTEKFPFSIPFDFIAFCRVLDAEPETPALDTNIDLKIVTWHIDYDLHQFDDIASLCRNLEFISFCIALVLLTRNIIKG